MPRGIFLVRSNCTDPGREEEYNRWYTHTHLPDLSKAKGFVTARRYVGVTPGGGSPTYLAAYEFDSDDITASVKDLLRLAAAAYPKGRHIDCIAGGDAQGAGPLIFEEIDPSSLKPLERLEYPTAIPDSIKQGIERLLSM